jgi:hypothetical protein
MTNGVEFLIICICLCPFLASSAVPIAVPIVHGLHEGSHAIGAALAQIPCVFFIGEALAAYQYEEKSLERRAAATYFNPRGVDIRRLNLYINHEKNKISLTDYRINETVLSTCEKYNISTYVVALVYDLNVNPDFKATSLFLFRTDIMRFSLSLASMKVEKIPHPQFTPDKYKLQKHHYSMELLTNESLRIQEIWRTKIFVMSHFAITRRIMSCDTVKVIVYEEFLADNKGYVEFIYDTIQGSSLGLNPLKMSSEMVPAALVGDKSFFEFKKIHPNEIENFVENADEVKAMFSTMKPDAYKRFIQERFGRDREFNLRLNCFVDEMVLVSRDKL